MTHNNISACMTVLFQGVFVDSMPQSVVFVRDYSWVEVYMQAYNSESLRKHINAASFAGSLLSAFRIDPIP